MSAKFPRGGGSRTFFSSKSICALKHDFVACEQQRCRCYDIKSVRKEEGKSYWKIPLCDDDATRENNAHN